MYTVPVQVGGVEIQNSSKCLSVGRAQTINCLQRGYPYPEITFSKDNRVLELDERVTRDECGLVTISSITQLDGGLYSCTAQNIANGELTTDVSDAVMLPPCSELIATVEPLSSD